MQLSLPAVRALLLHQQGLLTPPTRAARKPDVLRCIRRMQLLQIDTINVVARSPYLVLHSRLGRYEPRWLDELHASGKLFEYWAHAMCWIPAEDWPLLASLIAHGRRLGYRFYPRLEQWLAQHGREVEHVRRRIRDEGPLRSADFVPMDAAEGGDAKQREGWWDWKTEKIALDYLFTLGELMIARRENFQRFYDLAERIMPGWDPAQALPRTEVYKQFIRNAALALGAAIEPWLRDYYRMQQVQAKAAIAQLVEAGELVAVDIEGIKAPAYLNRALLPQAKEAQAGKLLPTHTALLSPFDPLVWDRRRLRELFGFDYTISVYTPGHAREHGYFVLPVLHRGKLIARLDPKAYRKDGAFEIRSFHLETGVNSQDVAWDEVAAAIRLCAEWHGTPEVRLSGQAVAAKPLAKALKSRASRG